MRVVGIRELRQNPTSAIAAAKGGEIVLITERGAAVAQIIPAAPTHREQMIAAGKITPASRDHRLLPPPVKAVGDVSAQLDAMRDAERY
ncbi:MAG: type II toxin-antitoxin system prevent-host-death family antitoxin [Propionibacteriaceae bacterium]|jgi:prevent-host-death family protein|nr:type II toxin-antitoxin system prevent-host-death family antitoxin [Propionibacteriaceae bacterium]